MLKHERVMAVFEENKFPFKLLSNYVKRDGPHDIRETELFRLVYGGTFNYHCSDDKEYVLIFFPSDLDAPGINESLSYAKEIVNYEYQEVSLEYHQRSTRIGENLYYVEYEGASPDITYCEDGNAESERDIVWYGKRIIDYVTRDKLSECADGIAKILTALSDAFPNVPIWLRTFNAGPGMTSSAMIRNVLTDGLTIYADGLHDSDILGYYVEFFKNYSLEEFLSLRDALESLKGYKLFSDLWKALKKEKIVNGNL